MRDNIPGIDPCPHCGYRGYSSHYHCGACGELVSVMGHKDCTPVPDWRDTFRENDRDLAENEEDLFTAPEILRQRYR